MDSKVYFIGSGPGDPDLLTVKAKRIIEQADVIVYADSLIAPEICDFAPHAEVHKSASLNLEEIISILIKAVNEGKVAARLHSGDPAIYGAIREQMDILDKHGVEYEVVPGVSSVFAAAAQLKSELTLPCDCQTIILTRREGKTPVPEKENLTSLAAHQATMAIYLSINQIDKVVADLVAGGYYPQTPIAVVYRATWEDEQIIKGTLENIVDKVQSSGITKQALILVGDALAPTEDVQKSKLYDKQFSHGCRQGEE